MDMMTRELVFADWPENWDFLLGADQLGALTLKFHPWSTLANIWKTPQLCTEGAKNLTQSYGIQTVNQSSNCTNNIGWRQWSKLMMKESAFASRLKWNRLETRPPNLSDKLAVDAVLNWRVYHSSDILPFLSPSFQTLDKLHIFYVQKVPAFHLRLANEELSRTCHTRRTELEQRTY